jgi:hypothetical protein
MVCGGFGSLDWAPFSSHSWDADRFSSFGSLPGRFLGAILDRRGAQSNTEYSSCAEGLSFGGALSRLLQLGTTIGCKPATRSAAIS